MPDVDVVFGPKPIGAIAPDLEAHSVATLEISVALFQRHPIAASVLVHPDDIKDETFIEYADSEAEGYGIVAHLLGVSPRSVIAKPDPLAVLALMQSGRGICVLPSVLMLPAFPSSSIEISSVGRPSKSW